MLVVYPGGLELEMLLGVEGDKPEDPEKNPRSKVRTNNKLNPRDTGPESNSSHIVERRALSLLRHPCSQMLSILIETLIMNILGFVSKADKAHAVIKKKKLNIT